MAGSAGVWGIEIGQSALKALHCIKKGDEIVADQFDLIEYPKILSQPDADPDELIADALVELLERHETARDHICMSVPGQSGLSKFFKPPPVDVKKIADIVRYEAKQQIPFELSDVIWDYQMMPGAQVEEGYALESEVGLFAMKREQAYRQLAPFDEADMQVDLVQLAPIAIYNAIAYDRMSERLETEEFDIDEPPSSTVILSIGTDSSDLIITNGFRIWQRSMPIGGNHFTRQLTKDLKLTFAKAEHLKRNAREAVDPKLIFQTMRPVFNDLVTEVQRSIGFFRGIDKKANITELLVTGNTVKMPGLAAYLGKNLGYEVHILDRFNRLTGDDVLSMPTFRDNAPTFAVCYGLCLQGLELSQVHTSLVPREILTQRMIRAKKPWALLGLSALLIGATVQYMFTQRSWATTTDDVWKNATSAVSQMSSYSSAEKSTDADLESRLMFLNELGKEVTGNNDERLLWLEVLEAINLMIPREDYPDGEIPSPREMPLQDRKDIYITSIESKHFEDLAEWFTEDIATRYQEEMASWYRQMDRLPPGAMPEDDSLAGADADTAASSYSSADSGALDEGPIEAGWVIQLKGYHYYNSPERMGFEGANHVRRQLTTNFLEKEITMTSPSGEELTFTPQQMGFSYPLQLNENEPKLVRVKNPEYDPTSVAAQIKPPLDTEPGDELTGPDGEKVIYEPPTLEEQRLDFIFQVVWKPVPLLERIEAKKAAEEAAAAAAEAEAEAAAFNDDVAMNP
ncbi:type IV pilus assembly protein PilM [Allorhodopirellula solitaria]|uniref:Competence protein A n=1 Tax=Allorhodopirellula solitaria TaxID=2527987 RepID=A0A5C5YJR9_9BACT|nr:type IV pilus assembly protein PilM [Allorhodopirellula solitaria]TWT75059.1 Competence protein A [Allorhodopirellula solitaria]